MRNQYAGPCYRCGLWVPAGAGYFEKIRGAQGWRVQHCYRTHNGGITCEMAKAEEKKKQNAAGLKNVCDDNLFEAVLGK